MDRRTWGKRPMSGKGAVHKLDPQGGQGSANLEKFQKDPGLAAMKRVNENSKHYIATSMKTAKSSAMPTRYENSKKDSQENTGGLCPPENGGQRVACTP